MRLFDDDQSNELNTTNPVIVEPVESNEKMPESTIGQPEMPMIRLSPEDLELLQQEHAKDPCNTSPLPLSFNGIPYGTAIRAIDNGKLTCPTPNCKLIFL